MKRLLLDTHVFVWAKTSDRSLKPDVEAAIVDPANEIVVSLISAWELCIKAATGKLTGNASALIGSQTQFERILAESRFALLSISPSHVFALQHLPLHHRDPFDRLLVAQAMAEGMTLVTADGRLGAYDGLDLVVGA